MKSFQSGATVKSQYDRGSPCLKDYEGLRVEIVVSGSGLNMDFNIPMKLLSG